MSCVFVCDLCLPECVSLCARQTGNGKALPKLVQYMCAPGWGTAKLNVTRGEVSRNKVRWVQTHNCRHTLGSCRQVSGWLGNEWHKWVIAPGGRILETTCRSNSCLVTPVHKNTWPLLAMLADRDRSLKSRTKSQWKATQTEVRTWFLINNANFLHYRCYKLQ